MRINFKVHGISLGKTNVATVIDGEEVTAQVDCLEVELTTVAARHGSFTARFVGAEIPEARAKFLPDAIVPWEF